MFQRESNNSMCVYVCANEGRWPQCLYFRRIIWISCFIVQFLQVDQYMLSLIYLKSQYFSQFNPGSKNETFGLLSKILICVKTLTNESNIVLN